jgi:hypothetical protein
MFVVFGVLGLIRVRSCSHFFHYFEKQNFIYKGPHLIVNMLEYAFR